ncbi:bi-domain-containing oxidoreductase [Verrucomicrobia bacterium]|nr:bi-domain-containing oxidoreductase [Verrucomicrobiota bacterium]
MLQILQSIKSGETLLAEVPAPKARKGSLLIATRCTLVSAGTERMLVDFGKSGWIQKARSQPDKVKAVIDKIKVDGLKPTLQAVQSKLDQPLPMGYCNVGIVLDTGSGILASEFSKGDRVVSNGQHAEFVCIPRNLCCRIPELVSDEEAAFTVVGAIGLQGIRLLKPTLGESLVVTGLGLIGLLCVQMLRANGCRVLGIDFDSSKCELAKSFGAEVVDLSKGEDPISKANAWSSGRGVDGVLITASTKSNDPVHQAAQMSRKRGRIVLVGVVGLELSRADFYEKELSFQVSCSYGPGRYDSKYEEEGIDYPLPFVRWTEQRNFEAFLHLLAEKQIDLAPLITHRFKLRETLKAYETVGGKEGVGILIEYPSKNSALKSSDLVRSINLDTIKRGPLSQISCSVIGAGNFTRQVLLPALSKTGIGLQTIISSGGVSSADLGRKFGFAQAGTDTHTLFKDDATNLVAITTRHNSHASLVKEALKSGKAVFVEKPLCLNREELDTIKKDHKSASSPFLMVGFNRRFAPLIQTLDKLLQSKSDPKSFIYTINAGFIPPDHWTQHPEVGGGRLLGEGCHFIDLIRFLAACPIQKASVQYSQSPGAGSMDTFSVQLSFADGSHGTVHYFANGSKSFPKERLEVFCGGGVLQLDNFRTLQGFGWHGFSKQKSSSQDKGHEQEMQSLVNALKNGNSSPIPFEDIVEVTEVCLALVETREYSEM